MKLSSSTVKPMIIATVVVFIEILTFNLPYFTTFYDQFRVYRFFGVMIYHVIGGLLLLFFTIILHITALKSYSGKNLVHLIIAFYLSSAMFLWSGIIDTLYYTGSYSEYRKNYGILHDSIWYIILSLFIFFFYLSLEFQETDYPPMYRIILIMVGVAPPLFAAIFTMIDGVNYINSMSSYSLILNVLIMVLGLAYTSVFGAISYYKSLRNVEYKSFILASQIQFGVLFGLTLSLVIFAINNSFNVISVKFPILLVTLLIPLIIIYVKNPNYISALATPLYELFVVDPAGITIFVHKFGEENQEFSGDTNLSHLKGGLLTALSTVFQEVVETKSALYTVNLTDRVLILEHFSYNESKYVVALISLKSCHYVRNSLKFFAQATKRFVEKYDVISKGRPLPDSTHEIITQIFY